MALLTTKCEKRLDEYAVQRWEGEGGNAGGPLQRGREGPRRVPVSSCSMMMAGSSMSADPRLSKTAGRHSREGPLTLQPRPARAEVRDIHSGLNPPLVGLFQSANLFDC
jgi:hypothetical protein